MCLYKCIRTRTLKWRVLIYKTASHSISISWWAKISFLTWVKHGYKLLSYFKSFQREYTVALERSTPSHVFHSVISCSVPVVQRKLLCPPATLSLFNLLCQLAVDNSLLLNHLDHVSIHIIGIIQSLFDDMNIIFIFWEAVSHISLLQSILFILHIQSLFSVVYVFFTPQKTWPDTLSIIHYGTMNSSLIMVQWISKCLNSWCILWLWYGVNPLNPKFLNPKEFDKVHITDFYFHHSLFKCSWLHLNDTDKNLWKPSYIRWYVIYTSLLFII